MKVGPALWTPFSPAMIPVFVALLRVSSSPVVQDRGYRHEQDFDPVLTIPQPLWATISPWVKGEKRVSSGFPTRRPWPTELRALVNQTLCAS